MFLVRSSLAKAVYALHFLTCASSAITPQPITVYFFSLLSQSQVLNCCGVLRLTLIVRSIQHLLAETLEKIMKKLISVVLVFWAFGYVGIASADQNEFCAGFEEGYKSIKGDMVIVPICPIAPITPIGSTDFREGIKAGIRAASR